MLARLNNANIAKHKPHVSFLHHLNSATLLSTASQDVRNDKIGTVAAYQLRQQALCNSVLLSHVSKFTNHNKATLTISQDHEATTCVKVPALASSAASPKKRKQFESKAVQTSLPDCSPALAFAAQTADASSQPSMLPSLWS